MSNPGKPHTVCPRCGITVTDLRRHKERKRCEAQHIRKSSSMRG